MGLIFAYTYQFTKLNPQNKSARASDACQHQRQKLVISKIESRKIFLWYFRHKGGKIDKTGEFYWPSASY